MRLEHENVGDLKSKISKVLSNHLDMTKHKAFFFGSRVTGKGDERSDIDLGIDGDVPLELSLLSQIKEDIEDIKTLYTIDVVDFNRVSPEFKKVAKQKIVPILV